MPITDGAINPQTLVTLNTVLRCHICLVVFSPSVTIAMSIMTINAATNDGVLIISATEIMIVPALEIAAAAPHAVDHMYSLISTLAR